MSDVKLGSQISANLILGDIDFGKPEFGQVVMLSGLIQKWLRVN